MTVFLAQNQVSGLKRAQPASLMAWRQRCKHLGQMAHHGRQHRNFFHQLTHAVAGRLLADAA